MYGTDRYSHGGDHLGVSAFVQHYFDEDLCILILSNNEAMNQYRLGNAVSDILHGVEAGVPGKPEEFFMSENKLLSSIAVHTSKIKSKWNSFPASYTLRGSPAISTSKSIRWTRGNSFAGIPTRSNLITFMRTKLDR